MKFLLLSCLSLSLTAQAFVCDTDSDCLNGTLSLVKQARKLKACDSEVKAIQNLGAIELSTNLKGSSLVDTLEDCIANAKLQAKRAKRVAKIEAKIKTVFTK